jgi:hypothetical protein
VDFGHLLRVPRHQLELLIGGPLDDETAHEHASPPRTASHQRNNKKHAQPKNQPPLFNPNPTTTTTTRHPNP